MVALSPKFLALALFVATAAKAQAPAYLSPFLLQPGDDSSKCLTAANNAAGADVDIQACTGADAQKWTFENGEVKVFGDKCLEVKDGSESDGAQVQLADCKDGDANQQWWYSFWDMTLSWKDKGKCLDLTNGDLSDGNKPSLYGCSGGNPNQVWNTGYHISSLPHTSEEGQSGYNDCGTDSSDDSMCQTAWINGVDDFCLWAPPQAGGIGDTERIEVAWCTKTGRGTRTIPDGTLEGVHFVKTPDYVQVTGKGDFTKINVKPGDGGGELDPHGADGNGNPIGGLVYGNTFGSNLQYHEWTSFLGESEFCFRACVGSNAARNCQHIYDEMGCYWNMPANYDGGVFETCDADDTEPMGVYEGTSTWHQGTSPTPEGHPPASSSNCQTVPTVTAAPLKKRRDLERRTA